MALDKPYCTIAEVKSYIRDSSHSDTLYEDAINYASRYIDQYTRRDFWYHDYSSTAYRVHPNECVVGSIFLPFPIITLTKVEIDGASLDATGWYFSPRGQINGGERNIIRTIASVASETPFSSTLTSGATESAKVELTGTFGYTIGSQIEPPTDTEFPQGIRRACVLIAGGWTNRNRREQVALDGEKVSLLDARVPEEAEKLMAHSVRQLI